VFTAVHDYKQCLKESQDPGVGKWLEREVYTKLFPGCRTEAAYHDLEVQKRGADRRLFRGDSVHLLEEKIRSSYWKDLLVEYLSSDTSGTDGWACKPSDALYHISVCPSEGKGLMVRWPPVAEAVAEHLHGWVSLGRSKSNGFSIIHARNAGYTTHSVGVPLHELARLGIPVTQFTCRPIHDGPEPAAPSLAAQLATDRNHPQLGLF
jgi:hypothetical protein